MKTFAMILREGPDDISIYPPEKIQEMIERYDAWFGGLAAQGKLAGAHKLKPASGRFLRGASGTITDGPFGETKEVIGGVYFVKAADFDEAVEIARTCPHLHYEGTLEIREEDLLEEQREG